MLEVGVIIYTNNIFPKKTTFDKSVKGCFFRENRGLLILKNEKGIKILNNNQKAKFGIYLMD